MKFWNRYHSVYDKFLNLSLSYGKLTNEIIRELEPLSGLKILDLGAGPGQILKKLELSNCDLTALDYSSEALMILKTRTLNVKRVLHDMRNPLPFQPETFDCIISINAIYTLKKDELLKLFKELGRITKKSTKIIIVNPLPNFSNLAIFFSDIKLYYQANGLYLLLKFIVINLLVYLKLFLYNVVIDVKATRKVYQFLTPSEFSEIAKMSNLKMKSSRRVYGNQALIAILGK